MINERPLIIETEGKTPDKQKREEGEIWTIPPDLYIRFQREAGGIETDQDETELRAIHRGAVEGMLGIDPSRVPKRVLKHYPDLKHLRIEPENNPEGPIATWTNRAYEVKRNQMSLLAGLLGDKKITSEEFQRRNDEWKNLDSVLSDLAKKLKGGQIDEEGYREEIESWLLDHGLSPDYLEAGDETARVEEPSVKAVGSEIVQPETSPAAPPSGPETPKRESEAVRRVIRNFDRECSRVRKNAAARLEKILADKKITREEFDRLKQEWDAFDKKRDGMEDELRGGHIRLRVFIESVIEQADALFNKVVALETRPVPEIAKKEAPPGAIASKETPAPAIKESENVIDDEGTWRLVKKDEIFPPGMRFRIDTSGDKSWVLIRPAKAPKPPEPTPTPETTPPSKPGEQTPEEIKRYYRHAETSSSAPKTPELETPLITPPIVEAPSPIETPEQKLDRTREVYARLDYEHQKSKKSLPTEKQAELEKARQAYFEARREFLKKIEDEIRNRPRIKGKHAETEADIKQEIRRHATVYLTDEFKEIYDQKTKFSLEEREGRAGADSRIGRAWRKTADWYQHLPLKYKLLYSGILLAGGYGASAGVVSLGLVSAGVWVQRFFSGSAAAVSIEGIMSKREQKKIKLEIDKRQAKFHQEVNNIIEQFQSGNEAAGIIDFLAARDSDIEKRIGLDEKDLQRMKKRMVARRHLLSGAAFTLIASGLGSRAFAKGLHYAAGGALEPSSTGGPGGTSAATAERVAAESAEKLTGTVKSGGNLWQAAHELLEKGEISKDQFSHAWGNSTVEINGARVPLGEVKLSHAGDKINFVPDTEGGRFEVKDFVGDKFKLGTTPHDKTVETLAQTSGPKVVNPETAVPPKEFQDEILSTDQPASPSELMDQVNPNESVDKSIASEEKVLRAEPAKPAAPAAEQIAPEEKIYPETEIKSGLPEAIAGEAEAGLKGHSLFEQEQLIKKTARALKQHPDQPYLKKLLAFLENHPLHQETLIHYNETWQSSGLTEAEYGRIKNLKVGEFLKRFGRSLFDYLPEEKGIDAPEVEHRRSLAKVISNLGADKKVEGFSIEKFLKMFATSR